MDFYIITSKPNAEGVSRYWNSRLGGWVDLRTHATRLTLEDLVWGGLADRVQKDGCVIETY